MKKTYDEKQEEAIKEHIKIDHPLLKEDMNIRDVVTSLASSLAYNEVEKEEKIIHRFWEEAHECDVEKISVLVKETIDYYENFKYWYEQAIPNDSIIIVCPSCKALFWGMIEDFLGSYNWTCPDCGSVYDRMRFLGDDMY